MGLDIFGHLVKKARYSKEEGLRSISEYNTILEERAKRDFHDFAVASMSRLGIAALGGKEEYERVYNEVFGKMKDFTKYEFKYEKMLKEVKSLDEVKDFFINFEKCHYAESIVYFRKVNFVYRYFAHRLVDECCFADKADIEDLISRCDKVLADHSLAKELLPTQSGFFFGSTDYDEWYFKDVEDCKKQMENLLSKYDEETDVIFFEMSW
jgi:hypothetical protein